jgi:polysaccharide export outer membrane protein
MSTRNSATMQRMYGPGISLLAGLIAVFIMPTQGISQQGGAIVANIDENPGPSRHPQAPVPAGVSSIPEGLENLKLAPGSLIQMDVYGIPELSSQLRVDAHGNVTIPLIGAVPVAGDTVPQAQDAIARTFSDREMLRDPQVLLNVLQFSARDISVLGEVQSPGRIQLLGPEPLGDVLALAGGETIAAGNEIEIQHRTENGGTDTRRVEYAQGRDPANLQANIVEPGDTVLVHRAGIIYVLGAVNRPGGYLMVNGGTLNAVQALSLAGGATLQSSMCCTVVVRKRGDSFVQVKVPLGKMEKGVVPPVPLQLDDVLYVPASGWKSFLLNGSNVLSAAAAASIYAITNNP